MGASLQAGAGGPSGARRRKGRRHRPMAEINVTPFVDVTLVLLIIFMVAAPLMTSGVSIELPKGEGTEQKVKQDPLEVSVDSQGKIFIGSEKTEVPLGELEPRLSAITQARKGLDETIYVKGDKATNYGEVMRVMDRIKSAGYTHLTFVTATEQ